MFPCMVKADETCSNETFNIQYCNGSTCLNDLQKTYNTWNSIGNIGKACIKVIAQSNGVNKSYFDGKNPNTDYKCANGNTPLMVLKASGVFDLKNLGSECQNTTCYIPELWAMDCGNNISTLDSDNSISINTNGQVTGTTEVKDTGVETYFIVLFIMIIVSYGILLFTKQKNVFKSI